MTEITHAKALRAIAAARRIQDKRLHGQMEMVPSDNQMFDVGVYDPSRRCVRSGG